MKVTVHASYIIRIIPITFKFIHNALLVYQWGFCFRDVKINWCDRERIETKFFFATRLSCGSLVFLQRRRQNRIQNLNKLHLLYFCYSFLYYCTTNLFCDRHVITILAPCYVLHVHVFCSQCFVIKFYPFPVRCLKYTSWKVVTDGITYFTSI